MSETREVRNFVDKGEKAARQAFEKGSVVVAKTPSDSGQALTTMPPSSLSCSLCSCSICK
jgi:hypothetical protein